MTTGRWISRVFVVSTVNSNQDNKKPKYIYIDSFLCFNDGKSIISKIAKKMFIFIVQTICIQMVCIVLKHGYISF